MADDELPCTQIVACRRYSLTIRRSEQFLHPLHPSVRHRLVIMQGIGRDGRHLAGGDPGTCLVVAGSERQGKPARARAAQRHLMIQYDRLTPPKWSSIAAGSLIRAGVASFTEHPAVLILPVKSNAASGVCCAIKKRSL